MGPLKEASYNQMAERHAQLCQGIAGLSKFRSFQTCLEALLISYCPPAAVEEEVVEEEVQEEEEAIDTAVAVAKDIPEVNVRREMPASGLMRHRRYRTIHAKGARSEEFKTACGLTLLPADFEELTAWPEVAWPLCGRRGCFGCR